MYQNKAACVIAGQTEIISFTVVWVHAVFCGSGRRHLALSISTPSPRPLLFLPSSLFPTPSLIGSRSLVLFFRHVSLHPESVFQQITKFSISKFSYFLSYLSKVFEDSSLANNKVNPECARKWNLVLSRKIIVRRVIIASLCILFGIL